MAPNHIAFIMDGNGRWASSRGLKRSEGYAEGALALERVLSRAVERGVKAISVFALSTENVARPEDEKSAIYNAVVKFNSKITDRFRVVYSGEIDALPDFVVESVEDVERRTSNVGYPILNICLNYGGRQDILRAAKLAYDRGVFTDEVFESCLSTAGLPPLDLIIRSGGQKRLSNFMLYEAAYAELVFFDKLWCDMTGDDVDAAIDEFESRTRKIGK